MSGPTTRVLALLELLQARGRLSGAEIAERLGVDRRTVRRYITVLEDLGIPVTTEQGRYGGYMLVPGFKLPPLMFTEAEVQVITLALLAVREADLLAEDAAVESVQAKLERVMPEHLKSRVHAIRDNTRLILHRGGQAEQRAHLLTLTEAAQARQGVGMMYQSPKGDQMRRELDPYGLVFRAGHWYVSGYCHLRRALRSFRLDRLADIQLLDCRFERPAAFDAARHLQDSLRDMRRKYDVSVLLHTDIGTATETMANLEGVFQRQGDKLLLITRTDSYCWFAWWLMRLPFRFTIVSPEALKDAVKEHAARLLAACLAEDQENLAAFADAERVSAPTISYEALPDDLKANGKP